MKFEEFKKLIERRNEIIKNVNEHNSEELKSIDEKLSGIKYINNWVDLKQYVHIIEEFAKRNKNCNLVEVKLKSGLTTLNIVDDGKCYSVLSYNSQERQASVSFLWKKGRNRDMQYLVEKYPALRRAFWQLLEEHYKKTNSHITSLEF